MEISRRDALRLTGAAAVAVPLALAADRVSAATPSDTLGPSEQLTVWQQRTSADGRYTLVLQGDGNVVVYGPGNRAVWSTGTQCTPSRLVMQSDSNLVLYDTAGRARWWSATTPHAATRLVMQSDGNLVIYTNGDPLWSTGTGLIQYSADHPLSLRNTGGSRQMVVVTGGAPSSTYATLRTWQIGGDGRWAQPFGAVGARVGYAGWKNGAARVQGDGSSPTGTFTLTEAYGLAANPGTALPYTPVGADHYRSGDPNDPRTYNVTQPSASATRTWRADANNSERFADYPTQYQNLVNIDYCTPLPSSLSYDSTHGEYVTSTPPTVGKGFAIYLHINGAGSTAGCVSIPAANLRQIMGLLTPAAYPLIAMAPLAWMGSI